MKLPDFLKSFQQQAEKLLATKGVQAIEFSGPTYQVQVRDFAESKDAWAFIQLNSRGLIQDCFCSCDNYDDYARCVHIAAGYLAIFAGHQQPLHQRFAHSLWNQLCWIYADRLGYQAEIFKQKGKQRYECCSTSGKIVAILEGKTSKGITFLDHLLHKHAQETEETSLKFSNLSAEELTLWREGKPSPEFSYELSFWNDLAKYLMLQQEKNVSYHLSFDYSVNSLPNFIHIHFPDVYAGFYLSEANLPLLIPSLKGLHSELKVFDGEEEQIESITYDKESSCFLIQTSAQSFDRSFTINKQEEGIAVGRWQFVRGEGFYLNQNQEHLISKKISAEEIPQALNDSFDLFKKFLKGVKIHSEALQVSYQLDFDTNWNLHIVCYLFSPGDLSVPYSRFFHDWVYLEDDGFYKMEGKLFEEIETVIAEDDLPDFINTHRSWLNNQKGFHTHFSSIESQLVYQVDTQRKLSFQRRLAVKEALSQTKDFGPWIYIYGQGFYSKVSAAIGLPVRPDIAINPDQIPIFIRMNREELKLVPQFFSETCPVVKAGIRLELTEWEAIHLSPEYVLLPEYQGKRVEFFEDFVFVEGEGFHELPLDTRLPEAYRHPHDISVENVPFFLQYEFDKLKPFAAYIDPRLEKPIFTQLVAYFIKKAGDEKRGWYQLKLGYQTDTGIISLFQIRAALKQKKRYLFSEFGRLDLKDKRFDWIRGLTKNRYERSSQSIWLSTIELIRLNAFEEIEILKSYSKFYDESVENLNELIEFKIPENPSLDGLESHLRPYQEMGVKWLWFLYHHGLSGLLCDDMGLGKTHQAMALFAAIMNQHRQLNKPLAPRFLVICPTSVIYHWEEKLKVFFPHLQVFIYHGVHREHDRLESSYDVLLTSYGIWRLETERLSQIRFELAIFDEIQIAKNHNSRLHASLRHLQANMRLGLTGTPIENHLRELKSLFDLVIPSYMPSDKDYREFFIKPIEKNHDRDSQALLSRFIKPFILRRKKEDVLFDLPEKIEEIAYCDLSSDQFSLYTDVLIRGRNQIVEQLHNHSEPVPYIHIFALLSSLKQICNHPACYLKEPANYKEYTSGKWDLFVELLSEARESQQKIVVFSQYLAMLDIMEEYLNEMGIGFTTIRGATTNRKEQLQRFNQDPNCEVFLGSLQASGLGVDLTAASVVIHYDRWWNAARENQATDRVHRIGQKRGVQVFKLVTKDTFEEKIDTMISRKKRLMEETIGVDDQDVIKTLDRDEIIELLQNIECKAAET